MSNERNSHRFPIVLIAIAVTIAILATFVTLERIDTRTANNETPPGTTGLAKPRPPLDRAPGQPVFLPVGDPTQGGTSEEQQHDPTHP
jgi:hypothetical protein